jgi:hypothetical protein
MDNNVQSFIIIILGALTAILSIILVLKAENKRELYKMIVDTATFIAIAAGLYFAWDQAKKIAESIDTYNRSLNVSILSNVSTQTMQEDQVFVDNPTLSKYFFDSTDIKEDDVNYDKVRAIALTMLDYFDQVGVLVHYSAENLHDSISESDAWDKYFNYIFKRSPVMCHLYLQAPELYGARLQKIATPACAYLKANH